MIHAAMPSCSTAYCAHNLDLCSAVDEVPAAAHEPTTALPLYDSLATVSPKPRMRFWTAGLWRDGLRKESKAASVA